MAVVIIPSLEGRDIEGYAFELANDKLGSKETNNGLLLLISITDRKYRFEVGRGLEPIFNDAKIGRIARTYLVPAFQEEQYGQGIINAMNSIHVELTGEGDPQTQPGSEYVPNFDESNQSSSSYSKQ